MLLETVKLVSFFYAIASFINAILIHMAFLDFDYIDTAPRFVWYCILWPISYPLIALKYIILGLIEGFKSLFGVD